MATRSNDYKNALLPLYVPTVKALPLVKRDELLYYAPHLVVNSYHEEEVAWYQSGFFGFVLKVVGFVIAIYGFVSGNPALGKAGASLTAMAWILIKKILISIVINMGMKLAVKILGEEFALLLAIALTAYGMMQKDSGTWFDMPKTDYYLAASNGLIKGVQSSITDQLEELTDASKAFQKEAKEKMDELEEVNKQLDTSGIINPLIFTELDIYFDPSETPEQYYERTVHTGNPGTEAYDFISRYTEIMLDLNNVVNDFRNGELTV